MRLQRNRNNRSSNFRLRKFYINGALWGSVLIGCHKFKLKSRDQYLIKGTIESFLFRPVMDCVVHRRHRGRQNMAIGKNLGLILPNRIPHRIAFPHFICYKSISPRIRLPSNLNRLDRKESGKGFWEMIILKFDFNSRDGSRNQVLIKFIL